MPFRKRGSKQYRTRISLPDGRRAIRSCGTEDKAVAKRIEAAISELVARREWGVLEAVYKGKVSLGQVYDALRSGALDSLLAAVNDVDLASLLAEYEGYLRGRGLKCVDDYMEHCRALLGTSFKRTQFTKPVISKHLAELDCSGATRNRHRGSLTQFAEWLVERGELETNPVRGIRGSKENRPRMVYYNQDEALAVLKALPWPYRAVEALMAGSGMEWAAVKALAIRDVNFETHTVHAHGTKNEWRDREVVVDEPYWSIFEKYAARLRDAGLVTLGVFVAVTDQQARINHKRAVKAAGLPHSTLHDWRHSFAVRQRRMGVLDSVIAHQLGHRDTRLVALRYGRFRVESQDYHARVGV